MIFRNRLVEPELIEELALTLAAPPHHRPPPPSSSHRETESRGAAAYNGLLQHYRHRAAISEYLLKCPLPSAELTGRAHHRDRCS
jgi:hypothetical protein